MLLFRLDWTRVERGHQLFRSLGKRVWPALNLLEISLLGQCWPEAPAHQHSPMRAPSPTSPTSPTVPQPFLQGYEPGREAELCCPPWFNYNQLLPLLCPVLDSLHIVLEKLSGIAAFVYIKYRMIEDLATALFSVLGHAFLPKHFPLLLPDHCLNCV